MNSCNFCAVLINNTVKMNTYWLLIIEKPNFKMNNRTWNSPGTKGNYYQQKIKKYIQDTR